jgi:hypothetical protein
MLPILDSGLKKHGSTLGRNKVKGFFYRIEKLDVINKEGIIVLRDLP